MDYRARSQVLTEKRSAANSCAIPGSSMTVGFAGLAGVTLVIFWPVLRELAQFSFRSDVYSCIPLVLLLTLFLVFDARRRIFLDSKPDLRFGFVYIALATLMLYASRWLHTSSQCLNNSLQTREETDVNNIEPKFSCYGP